MGKGKKSASKEALAAQKLRTTINKKKALIKHIDNNPNDRNLEILKKKLMEIK